MWIASVLLIVLFAVGIFYFCGHKTEVAKPADGPDPSPDAKAPSSLPAGYCFHLGHTWVAREGRGTARVGIDAFAASLLGRPEKIAVTGEQRWVRQGQKLVTFTCEGGTIVEMVSPVEGVVTAINPEVITRPDLVLHDPYRQGWLCAIKSPELETDLTNLLPADAAASWMSNAFDRLKILAEADPGLAQDGGMLAPSLLARLNPETRREVVKEFFLA